MNHPTEIFILKPAFRWKFQDEILRLKSLHSTKEINLKGNPGMAAKLTGLMEDLAMGITIPQLEEEEIQLLEALRESNVVDIRSANTFRSTSFENIISLSSQSSQILEQINRTAITVLSPDRASALKLKQGYRDAGFQLADNDSSVISNNMVAGISTKENLSDFCQAMYNTCNALNCIGIMAVVEEEAIYLGPTYVPRHSSCFLCMESRINSIHLRKENRHLDFPASAVHTVFNCEMAINLLVKETVQAIIQPDSIRTVNTIFRIDFNSLKIEENFLLKFPTCRCLN